MDQSLTLSESAREWGALWGSRPRAWAANEEQQTPVYEQALHYVDLWPGARVLDIGCGTGVFLRMCADRDASVVGVDAAEGMLEVARNRVPEGDFHHADLQALPFADDEFDLVTGFASFFFADDMVAALREAGRVAKPGAPVVIQVWGRPDHFDLGLMKAALARFTPPRRPSGVDPNELWRHGTLEALAIRAGLAPDHAFNVRWAYEFADEEALARGMMSAGGFGAIVGDKQDAARDAIVEALAPCRTRDGGYRLDNEWHFLLARA